MNVTLDDNIMFVSNFRAVFLKKLNLLRDLFPCHDTNKNRDAGILPARLPIYCSYSWLPSLPVMAVYMCVDTVKLSEMGLPVTLNNATDSQDEKSTGETVVVTCDLSVGVGRETSL